MQQANNYSAIMGLAMPPALERKTIGKMGLKGVPGLRIDQGQGGGRGDEVGGAHARAALAAASSAWRVDMNADFVSISSCNAPARRRQCSHSSTRAGSTGGSSLSSGAANSTVSAAVFWCICKEMEKRREA